MITQKQLGELIKARRLELGLTQSDVAEEVGIEQGTLCKYEAGTSEMGYINFSNLTRVLEFEFIDFTAISASLKEIA